MLPSPHRRRLVELDAVDHPRRDLWRVEGLGRQQDEVALDGDLPLGGRGDASARIFTLLIRASALGSQASPEPSPLDSPYVSS